MDGDQQNNEGRMLPQNIEAEQSVLAACMLNEVAVEEIAPMLTPENFYRPAHQIIYAGILDLYQRHIPVDQLSLMENINGKGQLEAIGGKGYLLDLASNELALTNWRTHASIVKRTSVLRDLVYASTKIQALAYDAPDDLSEVIGEAEQTLFNVTEKRLSSDFTKVDKLLTASFEELQELASKKGQMAGVPTGFRDIDELFNGLRGGDLIILAARPGVGKTSFALNMAVNAAKQDTTVAFMSLEMGSNQLIQRILCTEAQLNLSKVRSGKIAGTEWNKIVQASASLSNLNLFVDDTPGLSIFDLRAKARRELRDVKNGMIIVDYLQLMQPPVSRRDGNRAVEVAEISRGLKILAKEMNIPIVALSQLSRQVEMRGARGKKGKPQLSDLRESGSIEQDADIVMFIDRSMNKEEAEDESRPEWGTAVVDVAKHRNGPTRQIKLRFDADYTKFFDHYDENRLGGGFSSE
ncbi:MAG: replicative DNA helicase [Coriobacteriia bacterium]|nr:replicative DNA helicase [Coriobacteriia bacterium]